MQDGFCGTVFYCLFLSLIHLCSSDSEVVYVTPTHFPHPDCPDGLPCQTLQHYFSNISQIQKGNNLTLIFLSGQHEGVCNKTVLFVTSLTLKGLGQGVTVNSRYEGRTISDAKTRYKHSWPCRLERRSTFISENSMRTKVQIDLTLDHYRFLLQSSHDS